MKSLPEVEGHSSAESTNFTLFVTQRNISGGYLHTNRVDSADAEKDFRESTVRISTEFPTAGHLVF